MPSEGKLEGENARKHKLLSINKTPNNTSSLHQMSGFFARARAVLYFFLRSVFRDGCSSLRNDDDDDDGRREEALPPFQRENISSRKKGCFFSSFLPLCRSRRRDIFGDIFQRQKRAKKLSFASLSLLSWVQVSLKRARELSTTKIQKKREKELERENQNHFFSPQQPHKYSFSLFFCA